jgi:two-component system chemotaxis response regulator CheB
MAPLPIRVLIVDDSAYARKVLREMLIRSEDIEVVGTARDGLEALEKAEALKPDVITLDLVMPNLDGLGVLQSLPAGGPRVVVVSVIGADTSRGISALQGGAVELVHKPTSLATERLYEMADELTAAVRAAAAAHQLGMPAPAAAPPPAVPRRIAQRKVVVIGASTGGPQALTRLLAELPPNLPVPVALVLHLPIGYTAAFARRLNDECAIEVIEASDGLLLRPGLVVVGHAGTHLKLRRDGASVFAALDFRPIGTPHRPSVDVLFESAADTYGGGVLGVVLTGMGDDGLQGARAIHAKSGLLLTESEASCVVYGMPRCVDEAGLSAARAPIEEMAGEILQRL